MIIHRGWRYKRAPTPEQDGSFHDARDTATTPTSTPAQNILQR
jgi:hypothetical protein